MEVSTVLDVLNLDDGAAITAVKGKLAALYKRNSGQGNYGPFTVQSGELADGTNKIRVSFWNHEDLNKHKGKTLYIYTGGKPKDLAYKIGEYNGAPQPEVMVGKNCEISLAPKGAVDHDSDPQMRNADLEPTEKPVQKTAQPKQPQTEPTGPITYADLDADVRREAMRLANLRIICENGADYIVDTYKLLQLSLGKDPKTIRTFTSEQVGLLASSLFISLDKAGAAGAMPGKKITFPPPPAPEEKPDI